MAYHLSFIITLRVLFLIPFDKWGKGLQVICIAWKWQSRRKPPSPWFCDLWTTMFGDCQSSSWAGLRKLRWWGSCPLSRAVQDFIWELFIPNQHPWVCLFYWLCILKSLYWFWQIHLATQFSGCARLGSSTSSFFSVLCAISYSHTAPSVFPRFFSCSLTRFALCCCFLNSCSLALPPPACLIR